MKSPKLADIVFQSVRWVDERMDVEVYWNVKRIESIKLNSFWFWMKTNETNQMSKRKRIRFTQWPQWKEIIFLRTMNYDVD